MPKAIKHPAVNFSDIISYIAKELKNIAGKNNISLKDVAFKTGMSDGQLYNVLGPDLTNNELIYTKIAHAIGLTTKEFQSIKEDAYMSYMRDKYPEALEKEGMKYALSSELGNNPDALEEVKEFMKFVKQKYKINE